MILNIFVICPVRNVDDKLRGYIESHVSELESNGHEVHYPPRDTDQDDPIGIDICRQNRRAIEHADEVHIVWDGESTGALFDFGMAFALDKKIFAVNIPTPERGVKSFAGVMHRLTQESIVDGFM